MSDLNPRILALLVDAYAANARVAGMEAANLHRLITSKPVAYGEDDFNHEAEHLSRIAEALRDA